MEQELITLGILFAFALIGGILAARFKQPMLMGLLLVGALIGPNMFGLVNNVELMDIMIEFGAVLILFVLGLEFDIPRLKKLGLKPVILATLNVGVMTFVGFGVALLLGFNVQAALFLGLILSFGSTVIIAKVLENKGMMDREEVPLIIAVLIIDDIIAVMIVTFLSGIEDKSVGVVGSIEGLLISIFILAFAYVAFIKFVKPGLAWLLKKYNSEEIRTFAALAIWAGFAYLAYMLHLSPAVGAFMAGSIVTSMPNSKGLKESIEPYNLIISSFFFIAIGTLIDFTAIMENIMLILILVGVVIIVKLTAYSMMTYLFANMKGDRMFFLSVATFAIGEFSLLIAKESTKFNIGIDLMSIAAAVVSISAVVMALTINHSDKMYQPTIERLPWNVRKEMKKYSEYIKALSEEADLDNQYSKALKKSLGKLTLTFMLLLFVIFGYRKFILYIQLPPTTGIFLYITVLMLTGWLLFHSIMVLRKVLAALAEIFDSATNTKSVYQSKIIVKRAFIGTGMGMFALLWPFAMFMINLRGIFVIVSIIAMIISLWEFYKISRLMHDNIDGIKDKYHAYVQYNRDRNADVGSKDINRGWKF